MDSSGALSVPQKSEKNTSPTQSTDPGILFFAMLIELRAVINPGDLFDVYFAPIDREPFAKSFLAQATGKRFVCSPQTQPSYPQLLHSLPGLFLLSVILWL